MTGPGIVCSKTCTFRKPAGKQLQLSAHPAKGFAFRGWTGSCRGTGRCVVTVPATVGARFARATRKK